ncbi:hypothetical protein CIB48_g4298 [Xylaria polymorpha]|nr:hypothetical protein CIB48_g4298 [Xylaria polymorpha]
MASRAMSPLQVASRRICLASRNSPLPPQSAAARRLVATSTYKAKPYPPSSVPSSSTTTTSTTSKTSPPPIPPRSTARPSAYAAAAAARKPIPAVSGVPLPDAPAATTTGPTKASSPNGSGQAQAQGQAAAAANNGDGTQIDWTNSYHGLGTSAFAPETSTILQARLDPDDIEVKPDGIIYLPEIKYRRILNAAFGPGGWGLAPRGELMVQDRLVTREYALVVHGRFVAQARGEQQYFSEDGGVDGSGGVQVERADAVLQGLGYSVGAVGPALHPQVHEGARRPAVGRARHHQEEEADLAAQGRRGPLPV